MGAFYSSMFGTCFFLHKKHVAPSQWKIHLLISAKKQKDTKPLNEAKSLNISAS